MRLQRVDGCPRKLKQGQYKRVPSAKDRPAVGYYLACPLCGFKCVILLPDDNKTKEESGQLMSANDCSCDLCKERFVIRDGSAERT